MAKISTYPILSTPSLNDLLIGTDVENLNITKNFAIGDIASFIIGGSYVPYVGATGNVNLGAFNITSSGFIVNSGTAAQFLKANGTLDSTVYQPAGNYITQLSGEATASGPGNAAVTLSNAAVIGKVLTGLTITGNAIVSTDSILTAFGKVQNQINTLVGGVQYKGTWNAATNTPALVSSVGVSGNYYVVSVAGNTNLNGITDWNLGDWAIFNGSAWEKVDNTDAVISVNGQIGAVVLTTTNIAEGTNLYYTNTRARLAINLTTTGNSGAATYNNTNGFFNIPEYTLAGLGGVPLTRQITINGVAQDLSADRTYNVGTVTSIATTGPLTGGTITGSGTIGITQSSTSTDGYLSSTDWTTFNNKQNTIINPVTGTGTPFSLPMWSGASSLVNSPLSYLSDTFTFQYNTPTGGTLSFTNSNGTAYAYTIQMNNFGSPRSTVHSYTDGIVVQSIGGVQVSRVFANGNTVFGTGVADNGHKLELSGSLFVNTIANAVTDTDRFLVSDAGVIKYRTGSELLSDIGAGVGSVTSVGLTMPSAFSVSNSPITSSGTIAVTGAGIASQYVRGDGTLADFPTSTGGGASVSYYLNGSVSQGTIGGVAYKELSEVPIFGAGTDISIAADGYVASFLTDAGDPNLLNIPAGNWNFETYFSSSSAGGTPSFYVELYRYDGTTFTLIASSVGVPELISLGTAIQPYFSTLAVPQTALAATDRLAVRYYVNVSGRTITLHTENGHLCQIVTTFSNGLTALNGLTAQIQYFQVGTSGTDFNIASTSATHTFNLPDASATDRGLVTTGTQTIAGAKTFNSSVTANSLIKTGGTSSQFLKADGSVDSSTYLTTGTAASTYVPYTGATASVDLGDNVLTSGGLNIDSLGSFGGALNLRQATSFSLWTGAPYTSIYATPGNRVIFNFSNDGRTFTLDGSLVSASTPRTFTFPDATGTIALVGGAGVGTVTSVAALTLGTSGTDLSSTVANGTTTPVITLNVPDASASARGVVTTGTQRIAGTKTFDSGIKLTNGSSTAIIYSQSGTNTNTYQFPTSSGFLTTTSSEISSGIAKFNAGNQLLAAVAGTDYVVPSTLSAYLPLAGGTLTGPLNGTSASFTSGITLAGAAATSIFTSFSVGGTTYGYNGVSGSSGSVITGSVLGDMVIRTVNKSILFSTNDGSTSALTIAASTGAVTLTGALNGTSATMGIANVQNWNTISTFARFGHSSYNTGTNYGYLQDSSGNVFVEGTTVNLSTTAGNVTNIGGALNGTSASFSDNVTVSSASTKGFVVNSTNGASFRGFTIQNNGTTQGGIEILPNTGEIRIGGYSTTGDYFPVIYSDGVAALTFGIGASPSATFSSSVTAGGAITTNANFINSGPVYSTTGNVGNLLFTNTYPSTYNVAQIASVLEGFYYAAKLVFRTADQYNANLLVDRLTIASTGAATFSSSVTAGDTVTVTGNYPGISLNATSGTNFYMESSFTSNRLSFGVVGNSPIMSLLSGGNVGIGTPAPDIYSISGATNIVSIQATGTNQGGLLDIAATGTGFSGINIGNNTIRRAFIGTLDGSNFVVFTNPTNTSTTVSERMRISSAGITTFTAPIEGNGIVKVNSTEAQGADIGGVLTIGGNINNSGQTNTPFAFIAGRKTNSTVSNDDGYLALGTRSSTIGTGTNYWQYISTSGAIRFLAYGAGALTTDASGNITAASDERMKNISGFYTNGLSAIKKIKPITFKWKEETELDTKEFYTGFSAQNLHEAIPESAGIMSNGDLTIQDRPIMATIVNAINELNDIIQKQQEQINQLKNQIK